MTEICLKLYHLGYLVYDAQQEKYDKRSGRSLFRNFPAF